jgi:creatinine amidohydrolase
MIFSEMNAHVLREQTKSKVILFPLGAIEQHGPHLAVSTDTSLVSAVAMETEKHMPDDILLCPTLPFGSSHHHLALGGTISVSITTYTQFVVEMVESLLQAGFRRIVLLNGHGGNITPVRQALAMLSNKYDATLNPNIALATYWEVGGKAFAGAPPMESPALSHACEYETSLLLHLFPEKVFPSQIERAKRPLANGYVPWEDDEVYRGVTMVKQTQFISSNGSSGEPQLGTAAKGAHLFKNAVEELVKFIDAFKAWPFMEDLYKK